MMSSGKKSYGKLKRGLLKPWVFIIMGVMMLGMLLGGIFTRRGRSQ